MTTQSYSAISFPVEVHLVLFCELKKKKKKEFARSFYRIGSRLHETLVLDALKQNPRSQPHSSRRGSGLLHSKAEQAAVLLHLML